jgi:Domain of unknown function (DUF4326)
MGSRTEEEKVTKTKVVNVKSNKPHDIYVGRGRGPIGDLGNPFSHLLYGIATYKAKDLPEALQKHKDWLEGRLVIPELAALREVVLRRIPNLQGMTLGCFCRPAEGFRGRWLCHAQTLAAMADRIKPEEVE